MSDDRLFASNNPIGRKWYFINLGILIFITLGTYFLFTKQIIPNVSSKDYNSIANWIMNFFMFIYAITFFSLIERRLYDVSGSREKGLYKTLAPILTLIVLLDVTVAVFNVFPSISFGGRDISLPLTLFNPIAIITGIIFIVLIIFIGLKKGKKTHE